MNQKTTANKDVESVHNNPLEMQANKSKESEYITFIGAGIATSYALLALLKEIGLQSRASKLKIRIIDKYPELFTGIPYGERSGKSVLLINALESFIPEPYRGFFVKWLNKNKEGLIDEFLEAGGQKAAKWLMDNRSDIDEGKWDGLYIPRFFFGRYIAQEVQSVIDRSRRSNTIELVCSAEEVIDIKKERNHFLIQTKAGQRYISDNVVLSVGSLPTKRIFGDRPLVANDNYLVLNDIYRESLSQSLTEVNAFIKREPQRQINVLLMGANASALEILYKFMDEPGIQDAIDSLTVLSSQGIMPDSNFNTEGAGQYRPQHLIALDAEDNITAAKIAEAAYNDIQIARKQSLGAASTVGVISGAVGTLLNRLSEDEAKSFACLYGNNIGRMQRCAGAHYTNTLEELKNSIEYNHIAGRFVNLHPKKDKKGLILEYRDTATKELVMHPKAFNIVINCMGATNLVSEDTPVIFRNLIASKLVVPNKSEIGFEVTPDFEASENFYVLGPLLAGNVIDGKPLWHLEHCGRIIWSSTLMVNRFLQRALLA